MLKNCVQQLSLLCNVCTKRPSKAQARDPRSDSPRNPPLDSASGRDRAVRCAETNPSPRPRAAQNSFPQTQLLSSTKVCARPSPHDTTRLASSCSNRKLSTATLACRACLPRTIFIIAPPLQAPCTLASSLRRPMHGPRYAMLVHLAITLSTVHGWVLPSDDKASSLSSHAITGGVDGARARRQLIASGCSSSWSVCPPTHSLLPI